ncbi:MAG: chemotaxis protein CheW [Anaerolineales bacterium]
MKITFDITEEELPIFRAEANEQLQILEEGLVELERQTSNLDLVQMLFRAAHTLKGSAGMIGHKRMVDLTHALENLLDGVRKQTLAPTPEMIDIMLASLDSLHQLVDEVSTGESSPIDIDIYVQQLHEIMPSQTQQKSIPAPSQSSQPSHLPAPVPAETSNSSRLIKINATINPDSIASAARAFQIVMVLQDFGEIVELNPPLSIIETAAPVENLTVEFQPNKPLAELYKALTAISEIQELVVDDQILIFNDQIQDIFSKSIRTEKKRVPLGELLVEKQLITPEQLEAALALQQSQSGPALPLGQALVASGAITQEILDEVINEQSQQKKTPLVTPEMESADKNRSKGLDKTVRTSVERLDNLMNLIGELITDRNRMNQLRRDLEVQFRGSPQVEALSETIIHVGRITDMLQSEVMSIRMLPISNVFNKFPRLVRDLARKAEKQIDLVMRGEDTELDRSVIEEISDPLIHLIRNAVDHGIETPAERLANGKPDRGIIMLTARHEQGRIFITVEDNGRGIDVERVKAKAVEKGLISQAEADAMEKDEAIDLIFRSGLSTAKVISDVSGRGVGMDIVRANIERLNGNVQVETWPGKGSQFTIILPLTLAIVPTLLVKVTNQTYAIPLVTVSETLRIKPQEIQTINGKPVITLREHVLPVTRLSDIFGLDGDTHHQNDYGYDYIVVVRSGKTQFGIIVDELIGEEEVVVKSLSSVLGDVIGVSSAAILGDGQVALIVDIQGISKLITQFSERNTRVELIPN